MKLSIVTTLYSSAAYVAEFYERISRAASALTGEYELLFVNDGSPDDSLERVRELYERDRRVRIIDLSRNFGHHKAMMTGLSHVRGDRVFLIDVDLEEQPEWLTEFAAVMARTEADVVYAVQQRRKGRLWDRLTGALFYRAFNALLDYSIPENVTTARLMSRRFVDSLVQHREREMTIAGLWALTGYRQVPVEVDKRRRGGTTYDFGRRVAVFVNGVTSFSSRPLVYVFYLGSAMMVMSAAFGAVLIWKAMNGEIGVPCWPTLIVSIWFLGGVTIFCLGLIGIYLSKVFIEAKARPYTIVRATYDHQQETAEP